MNRDNSRSINILLGITGFLCCLVSGFVAAPKGLLADESANLISIMQPMDMVIFFVLPTALMLVACVLVIIGKMDILTIISVLSGGALFAVMDFQFGVSHLAYAGILINMIGVILMAAAVALQVFATETGPAKVTRKAAKSRNPKEFRYERSHRPAYDDIYMDASGPSHIAPEAVSYETEEDEYLALDALKEEEAEAEAAEKVQKEQEDEIEALLAALSTRDVIHRKTEAAVEAESKTVEESLAEFENELDADSMALLAEVQAGSNTADDITDEADAFDLAIPDADTATGAVMEHMAAALETPNKTMTDFYEGIEAIFLDSDNSTAK